MRLGCAIVALVLLSGCSSSRAIDSSMLEHELTRCIDAVRECAYGVQVSGGSCTCNPYPLPTTTTTLPEGESK